MNITVDDVRKAHEEYLNEWHLFFRDGSTEFYVAIGGTFRVNHKVYSHLGCAVSAFNEEVSRCSSATLTSAIRVNNFLSELRNEWTEWYSATKGRVEISFRGGKLRLTKEKEVLYLGPCAEHLMEEF